MDGVLYDAGTTYPYHMDGVLYDAGTTYPYHMDGVLYDAGITYPYHMDGVLYDAGTTYPYHMDGVLYGAGTTCPLRAPWFNPCFLVEFAFFILLHFFALLCFCLRPVSCVLSIAGDSGLFIFHCPFGFLWRLFRYA